jgi:hypothetical protein
MERDKALHILKTLADGIDPASGTAFAPGSPYQHADTVRALYWALQQVDARAGTRRATAQASAPAHATMVARPPATASSVEAGPLEATGATAADAAPDAVLPAAPSAAAPTPATPAKPAKPRDAARANSGRPWSAEEEAQLAAAFDRGCTLEVLAQVHQRSRFAIEARLARLGKIPAPASGLRFPIRPPAAAQPRAGYSAER